MTTTNTRFGFLLALLIAAGALVTLSTGCSTSTEHIARTSITRTIPAPGEFPLKITTRNGYIDVQADEGLSQIEIRAELRAGGDTPEEAQQRLNDSRLSVEWQKDGRLLVQPEFPGLAKPGDAADVSLRAPRIRNAILRTANGEVRATRLAGDLNLDTSNAKVEVNSHDGSADIDSSNAHVTVSGIRGRLKLDTSNGRVGVTGAAGPVEAESSNGSMQITLTQDNRGPVDLDTSNAPITLRIGSAFAGVMSLRTSNGALQMPGDHPSIASQMNEGKKGTIRFANPGAESNVETSNAALEIVIEN